MEKKRQAIWLALTSLSREHGVYLAFNGKGVEESSLGILTCLTEKELYMAPGFCSDSMILFPSFKHAKQQPVLHSTRREYVYPTSRTNYHIFERFGQEFQSRELWNKLRAGERFSYREMRDRGLI